MDLNAALDRLVALSEKHLQSTIDERWDIWEAVVREKKKRCAQLGRYAGADPGLEGRQRIRSIQLLEAQTIDALNEKKEQVFQDLNRADRRKTAVTGYGSHQSYRPARHFGINC